MKKFTVNYYKPHQPIPIIFALTSLYFMRRYIKGGQNIFNNTLEPDQIIIITGGTKGIGKEIIKSLASQKSHIIFTGRSTIEGQDLQTKLSDLYPGSKCTFANVDFTDLLQVESFAHNLKETHQKIDILVHNAGASSPTKSMTKDGLDTIVQLNYFSAFYLTDLLLPLLVKSPKARIINTSSSAHHNAPKNFSDEIYLKDLNLDNRPYNNYELYAETKLENQLFTKALKSYQELNGYDNCVKTVAQHPGVVNTSLFDNFPRIVRAFRVALYPFYWFLTKTPKDGAQTSLYCCMSPWDQLISGSYYADCKISKESQQAKDFELAKKLWNNTIDVFEKQGKSLACFNKF